MTRAAQSWKAQRDGLECQQRRLQICYAIFMAAKGRCAQIIWHSVLMKMLHYSRFSLLQLPRHWCAAEQLLCLHLACFHLHQPRRIAEFSLK